MRRKTVYISYEQARICPFFEDGVDINDEMREYFIGVNTIHEPHSVGVTLVPCKGDLHHLGDWEGNVDLFVYRLSNGTHYIFSWYSGEEGFNGFYVVEPDLVPKSLREMAAQQYKTREEAENQARQQSLRKPGTTFIVWRDHTRNHRFASVREFEHITDSLEDCHLYTIENGKIAVTF